MPRITRIRRADALQPLLLGQSQTVGKDSRSKAQRTSTTWFHHYAGVPELMARAARLLGLPGISRFEEPQTVRYRRSEKFTWHLVGSDIFLCLHVPLANFALRLAHLAQDALSPDVANDSSSAGQRVSTLLVYLTDLKSEEGGATMFRDLGGDGPLKV